MSLIRSESSNPGPSALAVPVPSGRWQSFPALESWPPSAVVGTAPPASPSPSPLKTFPHQPAGTERKVERVKPLRMGVVGGVNRVTGLDLERSSSDLIYEKGKGGMK